MLNRRGILIALLALTTAACDKECGKSPTSASGVPGVSRGPEVWLHPNIGSKDYLDMFKSEGLPLWAETRNAFTVFQFHGGNVMGSAPGTVCEMCAGNSVDEFVKLDAFRQLREWEKGISFEAGALKPGAHGCDASVPVLIQHSLNALNHITGAGGVVTHISTDWAYGAGDECGYSLERTAGLIKDYIDGVHAVYPNVKINLTEGYPYNTIEEIAPKIEALISVGAKISGLHIDYDVDGVPRNGPKKSNAHGYNPDKDLPLIRDFLRSKGITLGMVIWAGDGNSTKHFATGVIAQSSQMLSALRGDVDRIIFESWSDERQNAADPYSMKRTYPDNLPEDKPGTMTWLLLNEGARWRR